MKEIPQNLRSLHEDVCRRVMQRRLVPASVSRRHSNGEEYWHAVLREGMARRSIYLGRGSDATVRERVDVYRWTAREARDTRKSIQALTRSSGLGVSPVYGKVLAVLANAGLFERGLVLVGTVAYQLYPWLLGAYLTQGLARTDDADFSVARFVVPQLAGDEPLETILQRADESFRPVMGHEDRLPKAFASNQISVELLTTLGRKSGPVAIPGLLAAAAPLSFMDYLIAEPVDTVALYGCGVRVRIPDPARFAVHGLLIRREAYSVKTDKDQRQAAELVSLLRLREPDRLHDAISEARRRGAAWRRRVDAGLKRADEVGLKRWS